MSRYLLLGAGLLSALLTFGQSDYSMTVEEHAVDGVAGMTTYRLYIDMVNSDDFLSSIYGNDATPFALSTPSGFYNDPAATGGSAGGVNPSFLLPPFDAFFPGLPYDSWYTIGIEFAPGAGESAVSAVESDAQPWIGAFDATSALSGQDIEMTDVTGGAWYILNGSSNGLPDATNNRVLFMQITCSGVPSGLLNAQIFENGVGTNDVRLTIAFDGPGTYYEDGSGGGGDDVPGCTNAEACNFNADATQDDGSCVIADDACEECDGNGGVSTSDADGDGVCDGDEVAGCQDETACNFNADATDSDDSCVYADGACEVCDGEGGVAVQDADGDGICDEDEVTGCQDEEACNYDAAATDEGTCLFADGPCESCDGSGGVATADADGDGVCDGDELAGCQDEAACNYDASATDDDGSCVFADGNCEVCDGNGGVAVQDADGDGTCDGDEVEGCTDSAACNFSAAATDDDGSCDYCSCAGEGGGGSPASGYSMTVETHAVDGVAGMTTYRFYVDMVNTTDFLSSVYGNNDDPLTFTTNGAGFYNDPAATGGSAGGVNPSFLLPPFDAFFPGLPYDSWYTVGIEFAPGAGESAVSAVESDVQPWIGAFDATSAISGQDFEMSDVTGGAYYVLNGSSNGLPDATNNRVLCMQITTAGSPSGQLNVQVFEEGVGENDLRFTFAFDGAGTYLPEGEGSGGGGDNACGCTDETATNFDPSADYDDGSCEYGVDGCTSSNACNFDADATNDDGSCVFADGACEVCDGNGGVANEDADGDGVCDGDEVAGCQDETACNFNADATDSDDSCVYADGACEVCDGNGGVANQDADGDGVCDGDEVAGCQDETACNFNADATDSDDSCVYADGACEVCDGNGGVANEDADGDGVCDGDEVAGCQDETACNFNADATDSDDSCVYADGPCEVCDGNGGIATQDADGDGVCDADETEGCADADACNYNPNVTDDDGSCVFPDGPCEACDGQNVVNNDADGDGVCDADEIEGCQDETACNYDADATDAGECVYAEGACDACDGNGGVITSDADGDGVCDADEIPGCQDEAACNYNDAATDSDDSCVFADGNCEFCNPDGTVGLNDADADGICDDVDECIGQYDDCGVCNGPGAIYECGCNDIPEGDCDCDGNTLNECGECGVVAADSDGDGIPDCLEIPGCTDENAPNFNPEATDDDGSCLVGGCTVSFACNYDSTADFLIFSDCDFESCQGCTDDDACNYDANATQEDGSCEYAEEFLDCNGDCSNDADGDGVCDEQEVLGCTDPTNPGYDSNATDDDGSCWIGGCTLPAACNFDENAEYLIADDCDFDSCAGCTDAEACNYDDTSTINDGSCIYPPADYLNCEGNCNNDTDGDGICDEVEIPGCTDINSVSYNPNATDDDDSCLYLGCTSSSACNFDPDANFNDGSCDFDSCVGCGDEAACNFDEGVIYSIPFLCDYPEDGLDCDGNCLADADGDGVCDGDEIVGCQDSTACNYNAAATDAGDCNFDCYGCTAEGACNFNPVATINDQSCDFESCLGCMNPSACNFDPDATVNLEGLCEFPTSALLDCDGNCLADADGDGVCDDQEVPGCTNPDANNYNPDATDDNGSCTVGVCILSFACNYTPYIPGVNFLDVTTCLFPPCESGLTENPDGPSMGYMPMTGCDIPSACNYGDPVNPCDFLSCLSLGCADPAACNYDPEAVFDDGSCEYLSCQVPGCMNANACNYDPEATVSDGSCEFTSCLGCTDEDAANYDPTATIDNGSCSYPGCIFPVACNYDPTATVNDGSCEYASCVGCGNETACNYDETATILDNSSCEFAEEGYDCDGNCLDDADGDGVCDGDEIAGCTDAEASNYSAAATDDDGSCLYPVPGCILPNACNYNPAATINDGSCEFTSCVGCTDLEACNYDSEALYADQSSCEYPAEDYLDCDGNCINDADADGICDEFDACADLTACNYDDESNAPCEVLDACGICGGDGVDTDGDGVCDAEEVFGCTEPTACNYDVANTEEDGSCEYCSCAQATSNFEGYSIETETVQIHEQGALAGMTTYRFYLVTPNSGDLVTSFTGNDEFALSLATTTSFYQHPGGGVTPDGLQPEFFEDFPELFYDSYVTLNLEGPEAPGEDEVSTLPGGWKNQFEAGNSFVVNDNIGSGWYITPNGSNALVDENNRMFFAQITTDGEVSGSFRAQVLPNGEGGFNEELVDMSFVQPICGCTDATACNYNADAEYDAGNCLYLEEGYTCFGECIDDADGDGVCDPFEVEGCTDAMACNYNADATDEDNSCTYPSEDYLDCDGNCLNDSDGDGICDEVESAGCTDDDACNYSADATDDDGSCTYPANPFVDCDGNCILDSDGDGVCNQFEVLGCNDAAACNFNALATEFDGSCILPQGCETCSGETDGTGVVVDNDQDDDGVCDADEISGCQDAMACNYNEFATDADACVYATGCDFCSGQTDGTGEVVIGDTDGDGVCDVDEIAGCQDADACNYDMAATDDDGSCFYPEEECDFCSGETDGSGQVVTGDTDGDGVCDVDEIVGCQDEFACNYLITATDAGECDYCSCQGNTTSIPGYGVVVEELTAHADGELAGMSTYAVYLSTPNATDVVTSFTGNNEFALSLATTTSFYQTPGQGATPDNLTGEMLAMMPLSAYDSYVTIGLSGPAGEGEENIGLAPGSWSSDFESGNSFVVNDEVGSGWYTLPSAANAVSGADHRVLLAQLTTDGKISGSFSAQIFPEGDNINDERVDITFLNGVCGCTEEGAANYDDNADFDDGSCFYIPAGCTDEAACNFTVGATEDDGSCVYADGNCEVCNAEGGVDVLDADGDGVCDADEVVGCQDDMACNYDAAATDAGDCVYADGNCEVCNAEGGVDVLDADGDGVCDADEVVGCQDDMACNYDAAATDAGDCVYADGDACEICDGNGGTIVQDADGDGVTDCDEIEGCQDPLACDYNADATDAGACDYGCYGCTYETAANYDAASTFDDGSCIFEGCTNNDYQNFNPYATENGGVTCTDMPISGDFNGDGVVQNQDLLDFLLAYGQSGPEWGGVDWIAEACEVVGIPFEDLYSPMDPCAGDDAPSYCEEMGCTYATALNFDPAATVDSGDCVWVGCTDSAAYNYNALANLDDSSCNYSICPDFNGDGQVQAQDLLNFLLAWGQEYDN